MQANSFQWVSLCEQLISVTTHEITPFAFTHKVSAFHSHFSLGSAELSCPILLLSQQLEVVLNNFKNPFLSYEYLFIC